MNWLPVGIGTADSTVRLFCLAYAGGGVSIYLKWRRLLPASIGLCPVLLPGREAAIRHPPIADMDVLVERLAEALAPALDRPYAFFGYSLGAKLAYALSHRLLALGRRPPLLLAAAASRDPAAPPHRPGAHRLPDADFVAYLRELGGTPDEVLADARLLDLMLPALRADFALLDQAVPCAPLPCPIAACGGAEDPIAPPASLLGWARFTRNRLVVRAFPGGHFFLRDQAEAITGSVRADIEQQLAFR